jgi:hypothetical protein
MTERNQEPSGSEIQPRIVMWKTVISSPVYRYLNRQYIDGFFTTGKLRLSSFRKFALHTDELRHDKHEGKAVCVGLHPEQTIYIVADFGVGSAVLSTSTIESEKLMRDFGEDGYFRINNTTGFRIAIAEKLKEHHVVSRGLESMCTYKETKDITRDIQGLPLDELKDLKGEDIVKNEHMAKLLGSDLWDEACFLKLNKYKDQSEYRMVWHLELGIGEHIDITCPEAIQFCDRVVG